MLISVIIPVYNVEKYLNRCLESIVNQTYKNLEIILVDDGSPDNCPQMCDEWAIKDDRIKVIHKKNAGLGYARNSGIENSTGDYVTFVDSDDWIDLDLYQDFVDRVDKYDVDVFSFGYRRVVGEDIKEDKFTALSKGVYNRKQILQNVLPNAIAPLRVLNSKFDILKSAWVHIYKKSLLDDNNIKFMSEKEEILSEDICFNIEVFSKMNSYYVTHKAYYNYYFNGNSITTVYKPSEFTRYPYLYKEFERVLNDIGKLKDYQEQMNLFWVKCMYTSISVPCRKHFNHKYTDIENDIKYHLNNERLRKILPSINTKNWSVKEKGVLLLLKLKSPFLFYYAYKFIIRK